MKKTYADIENKLEDLMKKHKEDTEKLNASLRSKMNHTQATTDNNINVHLVLHSHLDIGWFF